MTREVGGLDANGPPPRRPAAGPATQGEVEAMARPDDLKGLEEGPLHSGPPPRRPAPGPATRRGRGHHLTERPV
jgi:hypothetical protein